MDRRNLAGRCREPIWDVTPQRPPNSSALSAAWAWCPVVTVFHSIQAGHLYGSPANRRAGPGDARCCGPPLVSRPSLPSVGSIRKGGRAACRLHRALLGRGDPDLVAPGRGADERRGWQPRQRLALPSPGGSSRGSAPARQRVDVLGVGAGLVGADLHRSGYDAVHAKDVQLMSAHVVEVGEDLVKIVVHGEVASHSWS